MEVGSLMGMWRKIANIRGKAGADGLPGKKGDTGTFASARAVTLPPEASATATMYGPETAKGIEIGVPRGFPALTDGMPTDDGLAVILGAADSKAREAIGKAFMAKNELLYNVRDNGVVGDGSANDTATVQALINRLPSHARIWAPPGTVLRTNGWIISAQSAKIDFDAATLVQLSPAPIFDVIGQWGDVHTVNTAVDGTVNLAASSSYAVGDLVKVFSDDVNIHGRPGGAGLAPKLGQFTFVTAIDGNNLTVVPPLLDEYNTRIKIAKMQEHSVSIKVGDSYHQNGGGSGVMYRVTSMPFADLKIKVSRGNGAAVQLRSCFGTKTDLNVANLPLGTGYGLTTSASAYGNHTIYANRLRHAYTDDTYTLQPAVGSALPQEYGYSMFDTIYGKAIATAETSWDTHHGGLGHKFMGCVALGTSGAAGFSLRGRNHELINTTAVRTSVGYRIYDEQAEPWATSTGHLLSNCRSIASHNAIVASLRTPLAGEDGPNVTIDGGVFESRTGTLLTASNTRVLLNNPLFRYVGTTPPTSPAYGFLMGPAVVSGSARIEVDKLTSGIYSALIYCSNTTNEQTQILDLDLHVNLSEFAATAVSRLVWPNNVRGQVEVTMNRTFSGVTMSSATRPPSEFSMIRHTLGTDSPAGTTSFGIVDIPMNYYLNLSGRGDPIITFECVQPVTAARILGGVTRGAHSGQVVYIYNSPDSLGPLRLAQTGGTITQNITLPATIDIPQGTGAQLVWNGGAGRWRYVSRS